MVAEIPAISIVRVAINNRNLLNQGVRDRKL